MVHNLPNNFSPSMLLRLLDTEGFKHQYDFVYLPVDFRSNVCLGYAFINLVTTEYAERFKKVFEGFNQWSSPSQKVCSTSWITPHQGLAPLLERFRNNPVMHETVQDENKPILLNPTTGERIPFPEPTNKSRDLGCAQDPCFPEESASHPAEAAS